MGVEGIGVKVDGGSVTVSGVEDGDLTEHTTLMCDKA